MSCSSTRPSISRRVSGKLPVRRAYQEHHRHLPAASGEHRAVRQTRGDGTRLRPRLQPEHLALCQHGQAGGRDRSVGHKQGVGRNREADSGDYGEAQRVSEGTWTIAIAQHPISNRSDPSGYGWAPHARGAEGSRLDHEAHEDQTPDGGGCASRPSSGRRPPKRVRRS